MNLKRRFGMKRLSRVAVVVVAVMLVFCGVMTFSAAAASGGNDEPSAWASGDVSNAIAQGIVPPQLQGNYTQPATRAEFCALVVALYETMTDGEIEGRIEFVDTDDINVEKAAYIGVVLGVNVNINIFEPDANLNRQQAATMLARLANVIDKPLPPVPPIFDDNVKIAEWAFDAVGKVQAGGIMRGVGEDLFAPLGSYTREQCITTIMRLYDMYEVLYEDEYILAYTAGNQLKAYYKRAGFRYDPDKMVWEVREDGVYIFGYRTNPEDGAMVREESGFYLVDINGNGHRLIERD